MPAFLRYLSGCLHRLFRAGPSQAEAGSDIEQPQNALSPVLPLTLSEPSDSPTFIGGGVYDDQLMERAREQWQVGDWEALASLDPDYLENHAERATLALLAAAGWLQLGNNSGKARDFVRLAQQWGCEKQFISQVLVSGVFNTLGRASVLAGRQDEALRHFDASVDLVSLEGGRWWQSIKTMRVSQQMHQVGVSGQIERLQHDTLSADPLSVMPASFLNGEPKSDSLDFKTRYRISELEVAKISLLRNRQLFREVVARGGDESPSGPVVSIIVATRRPDRLDNLLNSISSQTYARKELVIVPHFFSDSERHRLRQVLDQRSAGLGVENVQVLEPDDSVPLCERLNLAIQAASGAYWAKMNDDDLYLEHYLSDMMIPFMLMESLHVVGKCEQFVFIEETGKTLLKHPGSRNVSGPVSTATLVVRKTSTPAIYFHGLGEGEHPDTLGCSVDGKIEVFAADPFNHVLMRSTQMDHHTWKVPTGYFLEHGEVIADGLNLDLVRV